MGARPSSFKADTATVIEKVESVDAGRQWSSQQQVIFDWFQHPAPLTAKIFEHQIERERPAREARNLVVRARAGTGKTTTIIEGVNRAPEDFILVCAFNKRIAEELSTRITNPSCEAKTLHSLGFTAVRRQWSRIGVSKGTTRADFLTDQVSKDAPKQIRKLVSLLHTKVRDMGIELTYDAVLQAALFFDLVPDEGWGQYDLPYVVHAAISAVEYASSHEPKLDIGIDFADMIFLPLAWKLLTPDYQLVVVDEAQDMTLAQLTMAQRVCDGRICVVGDDKQAIYGFRGADSGSLDRLKTELQAAELPLTTTYRCAQSIVRKAQGLVPDIQAGVGNPEGVVDVLGHPGMLQQALPGQFILSRINAPLVSITLALIRSKKKARMAGRDIGAGIKALLQKLCKYNDRLSVDQMLELLDKWESKSVTRFANYGQLDLIDRCRDQADTIRALTEDSDAANVGALIQTLEWLFEDGSTTDTIVCSSVHKAKGLEADRVYVLMESLYRRGSTPEEDNIFYVAITRAKNHLTFVSGVPGLVKREKVA